MPESPEEIGGLPDQSPAAVGDAADAADASDRAAQPTPSGIDLARALLARARADAGVAGRRRSDRQAVRTGDVDRQRRSGPGPDGRDPQPVGRAVERLVEERGWQAQTAVAGVVARWPTVVGSEVAAHCAPERYAGTVLTVRADSTAWATQVRLLAPTLVARLNAECGDGTVTRVKVLGPGAPSWRHGRLTVRGRGPRDTYG